jgi:hypothetical protein
MEISIAPTSEYYHQDSMREHTRHFLFLFLVGLGFELRACTLARQVVSYSSHFTSPFCSGYFEDGALQTMCRASLKLCSSQSQSPK